MVIIINYKSGLKSLTIKQQNNDDLMTDKWHNKFENRITRTFDIRSNSDVIDNDR